MGAIRLNKIGKSELIKGESNWANVTLADLGSPLSSDYFAFGIKTRIQKDIFNFSFLLFNEKAELIKFIDVGKKSALLHLWIDVLKSSR